MTMKKSELYEQIEAYLNNTLPPDQRLAWEQRMAEDASLREQVELHRRLHKDYDTGRMQLRATLHDILYESLPPDSPSTSGGKRHWRLWFGLLVLILVAIWWGFGLWKKSEPVAPAVPLPVEAPLPKSDTMPAPIKHEEPIAMADPARYQPNPGMEAFVNSHLRSESITIKMRRPANGIRLMPNEKGLVSIRIAGDANWGEDLEPSPLILSFFDNRDTNRPLAEMPIVGNKTSANSLDFDVSKRLKLQPGLYYFTIEAGDKGEILYAGKFLVGQE